MTLFTLFGYNFLQMLFAWFSFGNLAIVMYIFTESLQFGGYHLTGVRYANIVVHTLYAITLVAAFVL
jgi:hypothetical protein